MADFFVVKNNLNAILEEKARELIRRLRDEVNRLKGEQGKPSIKDNTPKPPSDHSSEAERKQRKPHTKSSKKATIEINRTEITEVDKSILPADAEFKGYEEVVVQDIELKTDNVLFRKEKYYAASTHQTYLAELPAGNEGQFGPGVKAWVISMYYGMNASEPKIVEFLANIGIQISAGEASTLLIKGKRASPPRKMLSMKPDCAAAPGSTSMTPRHGSMGKTSIATWSATR